MEGIMKPLKTLEDWNQAMDVARCHYNHSRAQIVPSKSKIKMSRKMAFLSVFTKGKSQPAKYSGVKRTRRQTVIPKSRYEPSKVAKIQIFVRSSVKETISLRLFASTSISNLKGILQEELGIPLEKRQLYTMKGLQLCDALSLEDHGIYCDTNLELRLVPGLMGGGKNRRSSARRNKSDTTPGASGKSVRGKSESKTSREEEPSASGASSAESAAQSNSSSTATEYQQPQLNFNLYNSPCVIGQSSGNTFNYGMQITSDVQRHGKTDQSLTKRLLGMVQEKFKEYQTMTGLYNLFSSVFAQLADIVPGSVKFIVNVTSREGLDRLWGMYQSRELANRLTDILITDELTTEDKSDITLKVTIMESDYRNGCRYFDSIEEKLPERMSDWTVDHVKYWLLDIGVKKTFVEQLFQEGFDGKALQSYTREQLIEDFNVDKIGSRLISNGKENWLKSANRQPEKHTERKMLKVDQDESGEMGQDLSVQTANFPTRATGVSSKDVTDTQHDESNQTTQSMHSESTQVVNPPSTAHPQTPKTPDNHSQSTFPHHVSSHDTEQVDVGNTFPTTKSVGHCKPTSRDEVENISQPSVRPKQRVVPLLKQKEQVRSTDRESTSMSITHQHPSKSQDELASKEEQTPQTPSSVPVQSVYKTTQISTEAVLTRKNQTTSASPSEKETDVKKRIDHVNDENKAERSPTTAATISPDKSKTSAPEEVAFMAHKQAVSPHRTLGQRSGDSHDEEPRLRKLLTGDEHGELNESFYPVLVVNKPPESVMPSETDLEQGSIAQQFGFIKAMKWVAVLDFYSKSLVNGLCKLYHDERMVTLQQPELFKDIESDVELRNSIDFPEKTLWIFTNGREDDPSFETPRMNLQDWNRQRSRDVEASISFFSKPSVIPKGRAAILFLILSDNEIDILCDTFRKISSSFQGLQNITCIVGDPETYAKFVSGVGKWFSEDEINEISVVGLKWEEINRIMMRMEGIHQIMDHELPFSLGGQPCFLRDKQREEWNDITVIYKNECENTDMDESNPGYVRFAQRKELSFYHGEKVDWWNFAMGDKEIKCRKGCGHVLTRKVFGEVLQKLSKPLSSRKFDDSKIVTVTLLHEPGAGGSTLARHVFWELHRDHRCIVINRVTINTVNQIMEVRRYGYKNQDAEEIPPICVLVENLDDMELVDLIAELEEVSKGIDVSNGAVCVLLHCKRSAMSFKVTKDNSNLEIPLYHKLDPVEKDWFQRKYTELEDKEKALQTGEFKPDNLLAFMVMKEEFNPDYIKNVVSRILPDTKNDELLLIKYCAFLNSYRPDSVIPISCCDSMMDPKSHLMRLGCISHHTQSPPWENLVSPSFNIMVLRQDKGIKIFHKNIAEEVLRQILQKNGNQSLYDVTAEFLNSELLKSKSYSRQNLVRTTHDLLIRRTKLPNETKTDFSDLIEVAIQSEGTQAAIAILKLGFETLDDAFVAQQVARLYLREAEFEKAHTFADKALHLDSKNPYFWDTKGRIFKKHLTDLSQPFLVEQQVMEDDVYHDFTSTSFKAMRIFRKSYEVSKEKMQTEYTGLYAEVDVAFRLLKVIYTCVEPLRTHGSKTQHGELSLSPELQSTFSRLKNQIDFVLDLMDDKTTYYKDGSHAQVAKRTLDEMKELLRKYTSLYEKYFGEKLTGSNYGYPAPTNLFDERRIKVKQLKCYRFRDIFDLARAKNEKVLLQSLQLLQQNSSDYSSFDLKTQIFIHLALSSIGKPVMTADDVYQKFVRPLFKESDQCGDFYPPFFMMMFLWPIKDVISERKDRNDLSFYSTELIKRGDDGPQSIHQGRVKRHAKYNMKPRTYFFLGQGTDLSVFAHISELPHAAQHKLDKHDRDGTFWHSDFVKKRLLRLEGILVDSMYLVYRSPKGKDINIKLAVPYTKRTPSQEKVDFFIGFSWVGPVAYDVTAKNRKHKDTVLRFHDAYPKHILPDDTPKRTSSSDSLSISKLMRKRQDLRLELQSLDIMGCKTEESKRKKRDIQRKLTKTQAELDEALDKLEDSFEDNSL